MSLVETEPKDKGTILAEVRTDLSVQRTLIAAERTLMAWIRTSISMIGFGFSIYKFFQYQAEEIAAAVLNQSRVRKVAIAAIGEGVEHALGAARRQFENCSPV